MAALLEARVSWSLPRWGGILTTGLQTGRPHYFIAWAMDSPFAPHDVELDLHPVLVGN